MYQLELKYNNEVARKIMEANGYHGVVPETTLPGKRDCEADYTEPVEEPDITCL